MVKEKKAGEVSELFAFEPACWRIDSISPNFSLSTRQFNLGPSLWHVWFDLPVSVHGPTAMLLKCLLDHLEYSPT